MRIPQTWRDRSLLEDEPFLSAFKARQLAAPPTRRGTRLAGKDDDDARNEAIANEIREMKLVSLFIAFTFYKQLHRPQFTTVQAWLELAFVPHYYIDAWRQIKVSDPGMICLFVKFYWALSHSYDDAKKILQAAVKEQGFGYFLDENETLKSNIDLTKQVDPNQTSQIGDDAFQLLSKEVPDSIPRDIQKDHNAAPDCPDREGNFFSQTCPPSLDPTSLSLSVTRQIEFNPSTFPLPPGSRNTTAICDLPKKRKGRQVSPDRRRIKHRKINEATSDTSKLFNVSQIRNDVIHEKTKARPSQLEDINDRADRVSDGALCGQPPSKELSGRIPPKDAPDCPEREGKTSLQTCPPSLDPISLSVTREIEFNSPALPLPPDSQDTTDLSKPRKRQTSPDTPRKKHRGFNEVTSDASKLGDNNNFEPHSKFWYFKWNGDNNLAMVFQPPVASSTSESTVTRIELDETVLSLPSNAPVPKIRDPHVEGHFAQGKQKSRFNLRATKKTSVLATRPKDATRQPTEYGTTSNPKKRRASNSEGHQRKGQEVPVDQEDSVPVIVQPDLAKKRRGGLPKLREEQECSSSITVQPAPRKKLGGRPPKVKEEEGGSASLTVQPAPRKEKDRPLKFQAPLNAGTAVPFSGQNEETSITPWILPPPAQSSHAVSGLRETVEGFSRDDHVSWSMLDKVMKEEINFSENCLRTQEHVLVEEDSILDCEEPAVTQMEDRPTNIFPTHKPPLCVIPPIWAQVCDTTL
jgi:hypothetical protein